MIKRSVLSMICAALFFTPTLHAQSADLPEVGATYRVNGRLVPRELSTTGVIGDPGNASTLNPLITYLGPVFKGDSAFASFQFVPYNDSILQKKWLGQVEGSPKRFAVPSGVLSGRLVRAYATGWRSGEFVVGALALPAKLRFSPFNFSGNISLGPSLAWRWRKSATRDYHMGVIASVGTSSVQLTEANTDSAVTAATDRAAYYLAVGVMAEFGPTQVGFFLGTDLINDPNQDDWIYQGKPWFSIGIGAAIFGTRGDERGPTQQKPR